ncbi:hypothetical protein AVEN_165997-1 [Araneus ventricosus]|uniref:Uncharacterized protein n=1 Tax=Araneus ventricosus TaxID=182803 RepID=A0A4Y2RGX5_ARAVE|nr:hypothetical protein AVEN_165997-1 [Araneus ventricosus]
MTIFQPINFRQLIHGPPHASPSTTGTLIPYCSYFSLPSKRKPQLSRNSSRAREPPPSFKYLHRSHFSIHDPAVQMDRSDFKTNWISTFDTPRQFSSHFRIDERFCHRATVFARNGALVNVSLNFTLHNTRVLIVFSHSSSVLSWSGWECPA